jgi:hypothetical protein
LSKKNKMQKEPRQPSYHTIFRDVSVFDSAGEITEKMWGKPEVIPGAYPLCDFHRVLDKDWSALPFHEGGEPEETPKWIENGVLPFEIWRNIFYWRFRLMNRDFLRRLREVIKFYDDLSFGVHAMNRLDDNVTKINWADTTSHPKTRNLAASFNWKNPGLNNPDINIRNLLDSSILLQCDETIRYLTRAYEYRLIVDETWRKAESEDYDYDGVFKRFRTEIFGESAQDLNDLACFIWYNLGIHDSKRFRKVFQFTKSLPSITLLKTYGSQSCNDQLLRQQPTESGVYRGRPAGDRRLFTLNHIDALDSLMLQRRIKCMGWLADTNQGLAVASGRMLQHYLGAQKHFWSHYRWFLTLHPNKIAASASQVMKDLKIAQDSLAEQRALYQKDKRHLGNLEQVNRDLASELNCTRVQLKAACARNHAMKEKIRQAVSPSEPLDSHAYQHDALAIRPDFDQRIAYARGERGEVIKPMSAVRQLNMERGIDFYRKY